MKHERCSERSARTSDVFAIPDLERSSKIMVDLFFGRRLTSSGGEIVRSFFLAVRRHGRLRPRRQLSSGVRDSGSPIS